MKVIGITGGVGCGKSAVLDFLEREYKACICQLDEVAKLLQKRGEACFLPIVNLFGKGIIGEGGDLDRKAIAQIVFSDKDKLQKLNEIVHPEVYRWVVEDIARKREEGILFYVIEAALLPSAGYESVCDEMWYIYADEPIRRKRLKNARGYTDERITNMIKCQPDEAVFCRTCSAVIDNSGAFEETKRQIGELL